MGCQPDGMQYEAEKHFVSRTVDKVLLLLSRILKFACVVHCRVEVHTYGSVH